ncbi:MAG: protein kinase, partial [Pirellulales bacterium]|nr:protein kinase [Pirellulales bacterium]
MKLRDYELLGPLARGGMGTVYRARHIRLNRHVALKVLPQRWLSDPAVIARFEREMQAVGSLSHPAIVQATDGGEAEGVHFLVMELIDGLDGAALVRALGSLPIADACDVARQAAQGMDYVHQQGIVHRDLKPSNLMITPAGEVKVLDLGLARGIGQPITEDELTTVGQLMGTIDFIAPEQLENSHDVDERADVYSLGATLYKLLSGRSPHVVRRDEPLLSKLRRIASEPSVPLQQHCPDAPQRLCELVDRMLSRRSEDRPETMGEVARALEPFCRSSQLAKSVKSARKLQQQRETRDQALGNSHLAGLPIIPDTRPSRPGRWARRSTGLIAWAVSLCLLAVLGAVITLQTSAGQLVIETSVPDVEVRILKAGQPYRQLTLQQHAESVKLGAGDYEIEILSDADQLEIHNGRYTLKRGGTWLAKITHRDAAGSISSPLATDPNRGGTRQALVPTYEGRSLQQWLVLLRTERSVKQLHEACQALSKLADQGDSSELVSALMEAVKYHGASASYSVDGRPFTVWYSVQEILAIVNQEDVVKALNRELEQGDDANVQFALEYISRSQDQIKKYVNGPLLDNLSRLAAGNSVKVRIEALKACNQLADREVADRLLLDALEAKDFQVSLAAAEILIQADSQVPSVVESLRNTFRTAPPVRRAHAAWLLGDLGERAKPAQQELIDCVRNEHGAEAIAGVYPIPSHYHGMTSVKDAAVRALAEIGDPSVTPVLLAEWERRNKPVPRQTPPSWQEKKLAQRAQTHTPDWVADAIEQVSDLRPVNFKLPRGKSLVRWTTKRQWLDSI